MIKKLWKMICWPWKKYMGWLAKGLPQKMTKCKDCFCNCHCDVKEHSDANGVCACEKCNCNPQGATVNSDECLSCQ